MAEFDNKGADLIRECRNCYLISSPIDGIKYVGGPTVALLEVRSDFVLSKFVRECPFFAARDVLCAIT
jgi:hypothetical protein